MNKGRLVNRLIATVLLLVMIIPSLVACSKADSRVAVSEYGDYGAQFARDFASAYPYRYAYSAQEREAGLMIKSEFENLGYEVETQSFSNVYGSLSNNYIIRIEGDGFMAEDEATGEYSEIRRTAVIGAHYDSAIPSANIPAGSTCDAISDNASGIGCIMTVAKQIKNYTHIGFDVVIIAFGAGNDDYAGARTYLNSLSLEERNSIEVMYCIDSIYAGDKMYASAGYNSLISSQRYAMRRKLYQVYDVAYDSMLSSKYGFNLLYNESGIITDLNGDGVNDVYSEVSANKSDYVPFDELNIPVVYFDSYDYFRDKIDEMKETKNLQLQEFGGYIRGTLLDSSEILDAIYVTEDEDRLLIRVNNVAFCILESLLKGSDSGLTYEEYNNLPAETESEATQISESTTPSDAIVVNGTTAASN